MCSRSRSRSSSVSTSVSMGASVAPVVRATLRRARNAAATTPISTATMRSNTTVARAVSTSTRASDRVEARTARTLRTSTMCTAVTISTPARAARGMRATRPAPARTTTTSATEWTMAATRVRAPGPDVHRGPGDRPGGGHAPEQGRHDVGHPLAEQLTVRIVGPAVDHAVGHLRRQQALDRRQGGDGEGRAEVALDGAEVHRRQDELRQGGRQGPDGRHVEARDLDDHGGERPPPAGTPAASGGGGGSPPSRRRRAEPAPRPPRSRR